MPDSVHRYLDGLQHLWPYIAGLFATIIGGIKLWLSDRKALRNRIENVEKIAENAVTDDRLMECKLDVDRQDEILLKSILDIRNDMRDDSKINVIAHQTIMEATAKAQQEIMREILRLHK